MKHGLNKRQLAALLDVHPSYIHYIESPRKDRKYNLVHINALAFYFDLSPRDFLPQDAFDPDK